MKIIVLEISEYKDNDIIINGISEEGLISFKVRGAKKPNSSFTWLNNRLVVADVEYVENVRYRHQILKSARMVSYPVKNNTHGNIMGIALANEAVNKMLQDEEKHLIFHNLEQYIEAVKYYDDPVLPALIFLGKLIKIAGSELEVGKCVYCGTKQDIVAFSFSEGGFICRKCLNGDTVIDLNPKQMQLVRYVIMKQDYKDLAYDKIDKVDEKILLEKFYHFIKDGIGVDLTFIKELLKQEY